ncbi:calcium-binding protein [Pseudomonas tohonis]|uniref:Haemolysin-type calcium binding-related domain-containing protein n=1 Tax=Pseudomonas tohonis TaxID=2725477 RepID=A0ABQ4VYK4_9PSED|nr:calcium-binding protein [Pseudomonas tohonis]GJN52318.1 hypothetical protein TUM20286_20700 [Pseudomonas tohonis]
MLTQAELRDFIKKVVVSSEIGINSPYKLIQSTGNSGLSFGGFQHDVANNDNARVVFRGILDADVALGALTQAQANNIYTKASNGTALTSQEKQQANNALWAHRNLVDQADSVQLDIVEGYINTAIEAAKINPNGSGGLSRDSLDLDFIAELAMWGNRTNGLNASSLYLKTSAEVSREDYETNYLSSRAQFTSGGEDFARWQERVNEATLSALLKITIDAATSNGFVPLDLKDALDYFEVSSSSLSDVVNPGAIKILLKDATKISIDEVKLEIEEDGSIKIGLDPTQGGMGSTSVIYKETGVQVEIAGVTVMNIAPDATVAVDGKSVSILQMHGDLSATYSLSATGLVVSWKSTGEGLLVTQSYDLNGQHINTSWKQGGNSFIGSLSDLSAFISQVTNRSSLGFLGEAIQSKLSQVTPIFSAAAEGVGMGADNAASLKYLQQRLALEGVSDRWAPVALSSVIPESLALAASLSAAIQQALNSAQQRWNKLQPSIFTVQILGFGNEPIQHSLPLVLDITGNGIKLVAPSQSNAVFDHNADGVKNQVGWVGPDNGILVFDTNGNGVIDSSAEWFGESFAVPGSTPPAGQNGFSALAALTKPGSTSFSRETALINPMTGVSYFDTLRVWIDADQNGISKASELKTLSALGIASIDLLSVHDGRRVAGGLIDSTAGFTFTDGTRRDVADIGLSEHTSSGAANSSTVMNPAAMVFAEYASKGYAAMAAGQARGTYQAMGGVTPNFTSLLSTLQTWMSTARYMTFEGHQNTLLGVADRTMITTYLRSSGGTQYGNSAGKDAVALMQEGVAHYSAVRSVLQSVDAGATAMSAAQSAAQVANAVSTADNRELAQSKALLAAGVLGQASAAYLDAVSKWSAYTSRLESLRLELNKLVPVNQSYSEHLPGGYTFFSPKDAGFASDAFAAYTAILQLSKDLKVGLDSSLGAFAQSSGYAKAYLGIPDALVTVGNGYNLILAGKGDQRFSLNSNVDNILLSQASGRVTLQGFQTGSGGDQLQILDVGDSAAVFNTETGTRISLADGIRYIDLLGVNNSDLNLFANIVGVQAISFAGVNQSGTRSLRGNGFLDGQVHINEISASHYGDTLIGGDWGTTLKGGAGGDTFVVTGGNYWVDGGAGSDSISYIESLGGVVSNLTTGQDSLGSRIYNIENVIGSAYRDSFIGSGLNNTFKGGRGNDQITGGGGNDTYLFGRGDGADTIINGVPGSAKSSSKLQFDSNIKGDDIWLSREGDSLAISVKSSYDRVEVQGWFSNEYRKLAVIELSSGLKMDGNAVNLAMEALATWKQIHPSFDPSNPAAIMQAPSIAAYFTDRVELPSVPETSNIALETRQAFDSGTATQGGALATSAVELLNSSVSSLSLAANTAVSLSGQISSHYLNPSSNTYRYQTIYGPEVYIITDMRNWSSTDPLMGRPRDVTTWERITSLRADAFYAQEKVNISRPQSTAISNARREIGVGVTTAVLADINLATNTMLAVTSTGQAVAASATSRHQALARAVSANELNNQEGRAFSISAAAEFDSRLNKAIISLQAVSGALQSTASNLANSRLRLSNILPATRVTTVNGTTTTVSYDWASTVDREKANSLLAAQAKAEDALQVANSSIQSYLTGLGVMLGYAQAQLISGANTSITAVPAGGLVISGGGSGHNMIGSVGRDIFTFAEIAGSASHRITGFQSGIDKDRVLLTHATKIAYLDEDESAHARISFSPGVPVVTLTGVSLGNISLYENLIGVNTVSYSATTRGVEAKLSSITPRDLDGFTHVQDIIGSAYADRLIGDSQDNHLIGGNGDDRITGGGGNNILEGGAGIDTLDYSIASAGVIVNLQLLKASNGDGGMDSLSGFENVVGSTHNDFLIGDAGSNELFGGQGSDRLEGGAGNDTLSGDAGDDVLVGGTGSDRYILSSGGGRDRIVESESQVGDIDIAVFSVAYDQLWFRKIDNDLEVSVIGKSDQLLIEDWYLGSAHHVEQFQTGGKTLIDSQVQNLVSAMAAFAPPPSGQTTLPGSYQTALATIIAANWQ